jgi:hypothetical protein
MSRKGEKKEEGWSWGSLLLGAVTAAAIYVVAENNGAENQQRVMEDAARKQSPYYFEPTPLYSKYSLEQPKRK